MLTVPSTSTSPVDHSARMPPTRPSQGGALSEPRAVTVTAVYSGTTTTCARAVPALT